MLQKPSFTQEQIAYAKANVQTMTRQEIADNLGLPFWVTANNMTLLGITRYRKHAPKPIELWSLCPILGNKWWLR